MEVKELKLKAWQSLQLQSAIQQAVAQKAPKKFTLVEILKQLAVANEITNKEKEEYLETVVKKDKEGNPITKVEEPKTVFDFEISVSEEDVKKELDKISDKENTFKIPLVSKEEKILVNLTEGTKEMNIFDYFNAQAGESDEKGAIGALFYTLFWSDAV